MDNVEAKERIDTIFWVCNVSFISVGRYRTILEDQNTFSSVFPGVSFINPKINHSINSYGVIFSTTKKEITNETNFNLFKAWQISIGIIGMTSILEYYLKCKVEELTGKTYEALGIFPRFKDYTKIDLSEFKDYQELRKYYELRHILIHNLGRISKKFKNRMVQPKLKEGEPYLIYPQDLVKYRDLLHVFIDFIDMKSI